jgi:hypothetical protein
VSSRGREVARSGYVVDVLLHPLLCYYPNLLNAENPQKANPFIRSSPPMQSKSPIARSKGEVSSEDLVRETLSHGARRPPPFCGVSFRPIRQPLRRIVRGSSGGLVDVGAAMLGVEVTGVLSGVRAFFAGAARARVNRDARAVAISLDGGHLSVRARRCHAFAENASRITGKFAGIAPAAAVGADLRFGVGGTGHVGRVARQVAAGAAARHEERERDDDPSATHEMHGGDITTAVGMN